MTATEYYVVENVAQSHEQDLTHLENEDVLTVPVVAGPYTSYEEAENEGIPSEDSSSEYSVVPFHPGE